MSNAVKKTIAVILCLIMITGTAPLNGLTELDFSGLSSLFSVKAKAAGGTCGDNLTWEYDEDTNTLTISGTGDMDEFSIYRNVPWYSYHSDINEILIDPDVTSIGKYAFYGCAGLTSITIPDSVTSIGHYAFYGCTGLTDITIPDSVTSIGYSAFSNGCVFYIGSADGSPWGANKVCKYFDGDLAFSSAEKSEIVYCRKSAINITIPDSVTSIGNSAFSNCTGLTSITIPDSVTSIGHYAFYGCTGLTDITIPDSVTSIGGSAFSNCTGLTSITIPNSVTNIDIQAFSGCTGLTDITIPDSVTSIGIKAFSGCTGLTSITIPDSVTSIGNSAFSNCTGLTSITIPDSVTSINGSAFYNSGCVIFYTGNADGSPWGAEAVYNYSDGDLAFSSAEKTEIVYCRKSAINITIPDSVTSIGNLAFYECTELTSITIPDSVTSIGDAAFSGCTGLTSITIPESVTSIGESAFSGCSGLTSISIPDSVTSIGNSAFSSCTGLTSITIPDSVTNIGDSAFLWCTGLTNITVDSGNSVYHSSGNCLIETASRTLITGCKTSIIPADGSVTSIGDEAFHYCFSLTNITIPDSVTSIGSYAFYDCSGLKSVTIGNSVTSIGRGAFSGCSRLTSITIPGSVTSIGNLAFYECTELTSITIGNGVTSIGGAAFLCCFGLTNITIPDSVTSIGSYAFYDCSGLKSVTIGNSVTSIGEGAFEDCIGIKGIIIPDNVTNIGDWAFYNCTGLIDVYFNGSEEEWKKITIEYGNEPLINANIHYITDAITFSCAVRENKLMRGEELNWSAVTPENTTWLRFTNNYTTAAGATGTQVFSCKYDKENVGTLSVSVSDENGARRWSVSMPATYPGTSGYANQKWTVEYKLSGSKEWIPLAVSDAENGITGFEADILVAKNADVLKPKPAEYEKFTVVSAQADKENGIFTAVTTDDVSKIRISYVNAETGKTKSLSYQATSTSVKSCESENGLTTWVISFKYNAPAADNTYKVQVRGPAWGEEYTVITEG